MTPREIRKWARDKRARCASYPETLDRLTHPQFWRGRMNPALADLKAKPVSAWTETDCAYAKNVVGFNKRHREQMKREGNVCKPGRTVALLNWGHNPKCPLPPATCKVRHRRK